MSVCFEKARELGELILASEPSKRLADMEAEYNSSVKDSCAVFQMQQAQRNFYDFANQVLGILETTVFGDLEKEGGFANGCANCPKRRKSQRECF
ncbi:MAG: hypothetical protein LBR83_09740 [Clostridiales bacterium]|jgi:hypothetical protein|nr:hypothetical protein [Clostridiales bacterium]